MSLRRAASVVPVVAACATLPVAVMAVYGQVPVMPPWWVHFWVVGGTAAMVAAAAVLLTVAGIRRHDARTVLIGGAFAVMASLLAVHGFATPGVILPSNGLVAVTGGLTLPVGAGILALASRPSLERAAPIRLLVAIPVVVGLSVVALSIVGAVEPGTVPSVPDARSVSAWVLLAFGLTVFGVLLVRAAHTFLLTERLTDLVVVAGLALLATALYGALALTYMDLGWWLGHAFELLGLVLVGGATLVDLRRSGRSRALIGDLRAQELVLSEEEYLGTRVRALLVRLAEKDGSTEQHTRRVAALSVELGEALGLPPNRLRTLAIGGLLHDIGKLSVPTAILRKPQGLTEEEYAAIKRHPERGRELLSELGFGRDVLELVHNHHERLDGSGYPRGLHGEELGLEARILALCDVFDALVSRRVYRPAFTVEEALQVIRRERAEFDPVCVEALVAFIGADESGHAEQGGGQVALSVA